MLEKALNPDLITEAAKVVFSSTEYGFEIKTLGLAKEGIQLVYTSGLSSTAQHVNEDNKVLEFIELYFCLPDYFSLKNETWPIDWLNKIAAIPQKNKTWFGIGDSIPAGNPPKSISATFTANYFVIMEPDRMKNIFLNNEKIQFLAVVPIFEQELDYKLRNSHTILFEKFAKKGVTEMIDVYRTSVCRKRILGLV